MEKIRKIMVPVAFSPYSKGIIDYAVMLAKSMDIEKLIFINIINERDVEAVNLISSFGYKVDGKEYIDELQKQRADEFDKMIEHIDFPEEKMKLVMSVGHPAEKVMKYAVREEVDMIVMGVKAKSELIHAFTGSVAEKIFRRSPVTVVSYREESIAGKLRKKITS